MLTAPQKGTSERMGSHIDLELPPAPSASLLRNSEHFASIPEQVSHDRFATSAKQQIDSSSDFSSEIDVVGDTSEIDVVGDTTEIDVVGDTSEIDVVGDNSEIDVVGDTSETDVVGDTSETDVVGDTSEIDVVGDTSETDVVGDTSEIDVVGDTSETDVVGDTSEIDVVGDTSEIDVVGGTSPVKTARPALYSGVSAKMSASATGSGLPRFSISPIYPQAASQLITPNYYDSKSKLTSTPVSTTVQPRLQPHPPVHPVPVFQRDNYPHMPVLAPQPLYPVLPPTHVFQHYYHYAMPHPAFGGFPFPSYRHVLPSGNHQTPSSDQYASRHVNQFKFIDQPLNLTNRRPFQAPVADLKIPRNAANPHAHLFHMACPPTGVYPIASSSANHFHGDPRASQNVLSFRGAQNLPRPSFTQSANLFHGDPRASQKVPSFSGARDRPGPSFTSSANLFHGDPRASQNVPSFSGARNRPGPSFTSSALRTPKEYPLHVSSAVKHPKRTSTDCENIDSQSESKRSKAIKKSRKVNNLAFPNNAVSSKNSAAPAESTGSSQALLRISPDQFIRGVSLALPPRNWRPISRIMKAKDDFEDNDRRPSRTLKSKENIPEGDNDSAKPRNKPELFGDKEMTELIIAFYDCPERKRFCDGRFKFQVPKIPDSTESQAELREALLRLFGNSNLPPVPSALKHSVHALSQYPLMQHVFNLHTQGVNLDNLKFGAYGLAFENIRLVELGEYCFNDILDRMSYLGEDGLLHCLVKSEKTGAVCGHVAREIGKIRRHSKNHYPDKKWVCVFCRVQMCDMTDLERHTATHTELKPFECPQCSKKFCQKVTLTQHMHKTHGQELAKWDAKNSYICRQDGCSYSQGDEMACARHLKQHHGQSDYIKRLRQNKWPFNVLSADAVNSIDVTA